ncbi:Zinc finger, DksA/TraR C4-type [Candidatus Nanopelagicaceae bacterium]
MSSRYHPPYIHHWRGRYLFIYLLSARSTPTSYEADLPACSRGDGLFNALFAQGIAGSESKPCVAKLVTRRKTHKVRGVPGKKVVKKAAKKAPAKKALAKKAVAKKAPAKKSPAKKVAAKKTPAKKAPAKKVAAKKTSVKKLPVKKLPGRPFPSKVGKTTLTVDEKSQTVSVATVMAPTAAPVVEERRLVMPPPPRPVKSGKKVAPLKPIKAAPTPVVASEGEAPWTAAELKTIKAEITKDLERLRKELATVEAEMDDLIADSGEGAGDDQADSGTKTFEREHEMSLVINARDMVLQTERALERIENKSYGLCEDCGSAIGKARLQVFPRATLCMICKQKEERR